MKIWSAGEKVNASDLNNNFEEALKNIEEFTAGESISAGDAVCLKKDGKVYKAQANDEERLNFIGIAHESKSANETILVQVKGKKSGFSFTLEEDVSEESFYSQSGDNAYVGSNVGGREIWQGFITARENSPICGIGNITKIRLRGYKYGSPTGPVYLKIFEADEDGEPETEIASTSKNAEDFPTSENDIYFEFSSPVEVKPERVYVVYVTFGSMTTNDSDNKVLIEYKSSNGSGRGIFKWSDGYSTYKTTILELAMTCYTTKRVYAQKGNLVYVSDTAGSLSLEPGTRRIVAGIVLDGNTILLERPAQRVLARLGNLAGSGVKLPLLKDAGVIICEAYSQPDNGAVGEVVLAYDLKTSGVIKDHDGSNVRSSRFEIDKTNKLVKANTAFTGDNTNNCRFRATYLT